MVEAERVRRRYGLDPTCVAAIGNPLPHPPRPCPEALRQAGRRELGFGPETVVVAWHGRVEIERKGLDLLLEAWTRMLEDASTADVQLALMGTGGDAERLRKLLAGIDGRVTWVDEYVTDRNRIDRFLAAADVYAFLFTARRLSGRAARSDGGGHRCGRHGRAWDRGHLRGRRGGRRHRRAGG